MQNTYWIDKAMLSAPMPEDRTEPTTTPFDDLVLE